jgi:hypothetical protein
MSERYVTVYRSTDPVEAEILEDLMYQEGLTARLLGTRNAALLGAGQLIFEQRIEVPEEQVEVAQRFVEDFMSSRGSGEPVVDTEALEAAAEAAGTSPDTTAERDVQPLAMERESEPRAASTPERGSAAAAEAGEGAMDQPDEQPAPPRRRTLAGGAAFIFPGAALIYARLPWAGLCLTTCFAAGVYVGFAAGWLPGALGLIAGVVPVDLFAAQVLLGRVNRGWRPAQPAQIALGVGLTVPVVALAIALHVLAHQYWAQL